MPSCRPEQVPLVFSPRFQRSFVDSLSQHSHHLHPAAKRATERMRVIAAESSDPALGVGITVALQRQGGVGFDRLSRTNAVSQMMQVSCDDAVTSRSVYKFSTSKHAIWIQNVRTPWRIYNLSAGGQELRNERHNKQREHVQVNTACLLGPSLFGRD